MNTYQCIKDVIRKRYKDPAYTWIFKQTKRNMEAMASKKVAEENIKKYGAKLVMEVPSEIRKLLEHYPNMWATFDIATACAMWEYSKGVYKFHPAFFEELIKTDVGNMVVETDRFMTLPEFGVCVEFPKSISITNDQGKCVDIVGGLFSIRVYDGWDDNKEGERSNQLQLVLFDGDGRISMINYMSFPGLSVSDSWKKFGGSEKEIRSLLPIINIVLYIADTAGWKGDRDVKPPKTIPRYYKRRGKKIVITAPKEPVVWQFGEVIGAQLERWVEEEKSRKKGDIPKARGPVRPHYRRAHWRRVRCGKGWKDWKLVWVHQSYVNCTVEEGILLPVCEHRVSS
jgi:hypothetical protein